MKSVATPTNNILGICPWNREHTFNLKLTNRTSNHFFRTLLKDRNLNILQEFGWANPFHYSFFHLHFLHYFLLFLFFFLFTFLFNFFWFIFFRNLRWLLLLLLLFFYLLFCFFLYFFFFLLLYIFLFLFLLFFYLFLLVAFSFLFVNDLFAISVFSIFIIEMNFNFLFFHVFFNIWLVLVLWILLKDSFRFVSSQSRIAGHFLTLSHFLLNFYVSFLKKGIIGTKFADKKISLLHTYMFLFDYFLTEIAFLKFFLSNSNASTFFA